MSSRHKLVALLLLVSLIAITFLPTYNNSVPSDEGDRVNPSPMTKPLEDNTPVVSSEPFIETIPVVEDVNVIDQAPDTNFNDDGGLGGIYLGRHTSGYYSRGWFKFNLSEMSSTYTITRARMYVYLENEYADLVDAPIGAYYSSNDSWSETTLTWNGQPSLDAEPLDIIDNPESPNMFVELNYYSWDVTSGVGSSLMDNNIFSVMLKQENESITYKTFKYFVEREYNSSRAAYLELEWHSLPESSSSFNGTIPVIEDASVIDQAPDTNFNDGGGLGGIYLGRHTSGYYSRGWFKFNLSNIPSNFQITNARMFVYLENEYADLVDAPIGAYYGSNNSWSETTLTWNNQPAPDEVHLDLIDSPASPNMFVELNYYSWDVTSAISSSLVHDSIMSIMLRQENESITYKTFKYFVEREYNSSRAAYLELEWQTGQRHTAQLPILEEETVYDGSPDTNLNGTETSGGIFVGRHVSGAYGRGWFKFDLSVVPSEFRLSSARMFVYLENEYADMVDAPIGAYYSVDDSWSETTITWNNQPSYDSIPSDLIDSPVSPDMFVEFNYYSWEVTNAFITSMMDNGYLSIVLQQVNESIDYSTFKYFAETEYNSSLAPYLEVEWYEPATTVLTVDGQTNSPHLDYISNPNPELGWSFYDPDIDDSQRGFEVDLHDEYGSHMWNVNQSNYATVFDQGTDQNARPFYSTSEMKFQFKYPSGLVPQSGVVDKLYFDIDLTTADVTFFGLQIFMINMNNDSALSNDFSKNYDGNELTSVFFASEYNPEIQNGQLVIDVMNNFFLNKDMDLFIELKYTSMTGPAISSNYSLASTGSVAYLYGPKASVNGTADYTYSRTYNMYLEFVTDVVSDGGPATHVYPFNATHPLTIQIKYNKSLIGHSGFVDRLYFRVENKSGSLTLHNFSLYLVETTLQGSLGYNFITNYQGATPMMVLDEASYEMNYQDYWLVIDIPDDFHYTGMNDLLVEFRFTSITGMSTLTHLFASSAPDIGSRAYGYSVVSDWAVIIDDYTYDFAIDLVHPESSVVYDGPSLVNATSYTFSVRTHDTFGQWSHWSELNFTCNTFGWSPSWTSHYTTGDTIALGTSTTVSIYVHHPEGIDMVLFSGSGVNHTMTNASNTYSYTWTPTSLGSNPYSIYMSSTLGYWNVTGGIITTIDGFSPSINSVERNPLAPSDAESVTITANVSDDIAISTVILYYFDGVLVSNLTMNLSGSLYEATIPAYPRSTYVVYQVWANDTSDNEILSSADGYTVIESAPQWSNLIESSGSIELGASVTVSLNVTHSIGVSSVYLEHSGANYTMGNTSEIYEWTWVPASIGQANYVIYMLSNNGYWNTTLGSIDVVDTTDPIVVSFSINPLVPKDTDTVTVTANLTDLGGFQEVILQYDTGSGWVNVTMTGNGTLFTGVIPTLPSQTNVTYRIYAMDPSGNWILSSQDNYTVTSSTTTTSTTTTTTVTTTTTTTIDTTTTSTTTTTTPLDFTNILIVVAIASGILVVVIVVVAIKNAQKKS